MSDLWIAVIGLAAFFAAIAVIVLALDKTLDAGDGHLAPETETVNRCIEQLETNLRGWEAKRKCARSSGGAPSEN